MDHVEPLQHLSAPGRRPATARLRRADLGIGQASPFQWYSFGRRQALAFGEASGSAIFEKFFLADRYRRAVRPRATARCADDW